MLDELQKAEINVLEMENVIFQGAKTAVANICLSAKPSKGVRSQRWWWVAAEIVAVASGSHSTRSASEPGAISPFRG